MSHLNVNDARRAALFASTLQRSDHPSAADMLEAMSRAVRQFGTRGSAARMAQEFGDHPEAAVMRMRWVREVVAERFACRAAPPGPVSVFRSSITSRFPRSSAKAGEAATSMPIAV